MVFDGGRESWEDDGRKRGIGPLLRRLARHLNERDPIAWAVVALALSLVWAVEKLGGN